MPRVNIKTFTGREEEYEPSCNLYDEIITQRLPMDNFNKIQAYYDAHSRIPSAWKALWTDIGSQYDRVIMFYNCDLTTLDEQNQEQQWQAMTVFARDNSVVSLLLISSNSLLDQLWQEHHPNNFEVRTPLSFGLPLDEFSSLEKYLSTHGVDIETQDLRGKQDSVPTIKTIEFMLLKSRLRLRGVQDSIPNVNLLLRFNDADMDIQEFIFAIEMYLRNPKTQPWILSPGQLHFFAGSPDEYVCNTRSPLGYEGEGDFSAVRAYYARQSIRPKVWYELWTQVPTYAITGSPPDLLGLLSVHYNRVVTLSLCNFVTVEPDGTETVWASAVIFMRNNRINNVLLVKTIQDTLGLCTVHHPNQFEFVALPALKRSHRLRPLSGYLDGSLTGTPVEMQVINAHNAPIEGTRILMHPAGINAFGMTLAAYLKDALGRS